MAQASQVSGHIIMSQSSGVPGGRVSVDSCRVVLVTGQ